MSISESLLPELDHEMRTTRALLERVPDDKAAFKPHTRSMSMGQLAAHLPGLLRWVPVIVSRTEFDLTSSESRALNIEWESRASTLTSFDREVTAARAAIAGASDQVLLEPWTLRAGAHTLSTTSRVATLRSVVMNHVIHHRGQLSVYLRLNDVPLPDMYGPTADSAR